VRLPPSVAGTVIAIAFGVWSASNSTHAQRHTPLFVDATDESGIDFTYVNGATGELLLPEVIGGGGALFDYDNDGDLDVFAVQGEGVRGQGAGLSRQEGSGPEARGARLYRNELRVAADGTRSVRFVDVTAQSRIDARGYGMGAATGDYDNDGWIDLYVTYLGSNRMFRNNGDGTFSDVTTKTGTDDGRWSTSATFVDYDRDGWLDLFVVNYVNFSVEMKRACFSAGSAHDYCNPVVYDPAPDTLFHNNRDGTFSDVSVRTGIRRSAGRGLGVLALDVNGDGWIDLYVANDGDPNQLLINERGQTFADEALLTGVAVSRAGVAQGSMGVDAADVDGDGDEDLFVTNLDNESNTFYRNIGRGLFEDRTVEVGAFKLGLTGFGTRFIDIDNDGWMDLVAVNGAVRHLNRQLQRGDPFPLKQPKLVLRNESGKRFVDVTAQAGPSFERLEVSRGLSMGDLDNDGDSDLVVFNNSGRARVLLNAAASGRHWVGVRVLAGRRDAVQTRLELPRRTGSLWRRVQTDGSYLSASDPRVVFGLGAETTAQTIRVHWVGGKPEEFAALAVDRYWVLEAGKPPRAF
jgi:enediyne biosynthesis protein E4